MEPGAYERAAHREEAVLRLEHQVVIVTGGATGIGGAISRVLVRRGAKVVAVDIDAAAGAELETELGAAAAFA